MGDDKGDGGFSRQFQGSVNNTSSAVLGLLLHYHVNQTMSQFVKGEGNSVYEGDGAWWTGGTERRRKR